MCIYLFKPHTIQLSQHYYLYLAEIETVAQMLGDLLKTTVLPRLEASSLKSSLGFLFSVKGYQVYSSPILVENLLTIYKQHFFLFLRYSESYSLWFVLKSAVYKNFLLSPAQVAKIPMNIFLYLCTGLPAKSGGHLAKTFLACLQIMLCRPLHLIDETFYRRILQYEIELFYVLPVGEFKVFLEDLLESPIKNH